MDYTDLQILLYLMSTSTDRHRPTPDVWKGDGGSVKTRHSSLVSRDFLKLPLDDSWKHHMVLRADGEGILVTAPCKRDDVFSQLGERNDLVHIPSPGAVDGA